MEHHFDHEVEDPFGNAPKAYVPRSEELWQSETQCHLRDMVVELCRPTIVKSALLSADIDRLDGVLTTENERMLIVEGKLSKMEDNQENINVFRGQMKKLNENLCELQAKIDKVFASSTAGLRERELENNASRQAIDRLDTQVQRITLDMDQVRRDTKEATTSMEVLLEKTRDVQIEEIRRLDSTVLGLDHALKSLSEEVWGPETMVTDLSFQPPSLRRLDSQMRKANQQITDLISETKKVAELTQSVEAMEVEQTGIIASSKEISSTFDDIKKSIFTIDRDSKAYNKESTNKMTAYCATIMKDLRKQIYTDMQSLEATQSNAGQYLRDMEASVQVLADKCGASERQVEAVVREMRTEVEGMDSRRRRDKQSMEKGLQTALERSGVALEASEASLQGLEHVSSVMGMSLQSERVSVALEVQDFKERSTTPYVGLRGHDEKPRARSTIVRRGGVDTDLLVRLTYTPQPVCFQGTPFERPQLLALREKLVHGAQESLLQGPASTAKRKLRELADQDRSVVTPDFTEPLLVAEALGTPDPDLQLLTGQRRRAPAGSARPGSVPLVPRPGSRGQPSARGSPLPEGDVGFRHPGEGPPPPAAPAPPPTSMSSHRPHSSATTAAASAVEDDGGGSRGLGGLPLLAAQSPPLTAR